MRDENLPSAPDTLNLGLVLGSSPTILLSPVTPGARNVNGWDWLYSTDFQNMWTYKD